MKKLEKNIFTISKQAFLLEKSDFFGRACFLFVDFLCYYKHNMTKTRPIGWLDLCENMNLGGSNENI